MASKVFVTKKHIKEGETPGDIAKEWEGLTGYRVSVRDGGSFLELDVDYGVPITHEPQKYFAGQGLKRKKI